MQNNSLVFDLIHQEHQRQLYGIELIASENFVSESVMKAMGSVLTNKYAEGLPGKRYYGVATSLIKSNSSPLTV